jgi:hypothetical protein
VNNVAIEIKEYIGATFSEQNHHGFNSINLTESTHYSNRVAPNSLMVDIEGLHSVITRNDTFYTDQAMKDSEKYWTVPYERPVIMHHNEKDGITIGRVKRAYWTDKNTRSGTGALRFITNIGHKEGLEGINNGSLSTVSVGLIAHDVRCSICNEQVELDENGAPECGHYKGATYDDKHCYWIINKFEPKELSFVIVPSDPYAHILKVYKPDSKDLNLSESKNNKEVNEMFENPFMDLIEESNETIKGLSESLDNNSKKEDKKEEETTKTETEEVVEESTEETVEETTTEEESIEETKTTTEESTEETVEETTTEEETETAEKTEEKVEEEQEKTEEQVEETKEETEEETEEEKKSMPKVIEEEVKKDIESQKEDIYKDIETKLKKAEAENSTLKEEIANLKKEVAQITNKLQTEKSLKESAEAELMELRTMRKRNLVEQVNSLRKKASLNPEKVEDLMEASEETLHFTIKNLKEFNSKMVDLSSLTTLKSEVAISESKDNSQKTTKQDVKESKANSNINLEEDMESTMLDILSKAFGGF